MWKNDAGMAISELVTNEEYKQSLGKKARDDAEKGVFAPPFSKVEGNYARQAFCDGANAVYLQAFQKRRDRLKRARA